MKRLWWPALLALAGGAQAAGPSPCDRFVGRLPNALRTPLDAEMRQMWLDLLRWTAAKLPCDRPGGR